MVWGAWSFFELFRALLRLRVSNGPGRFGGNASQGSFLTCFEVPRFQTDPVNLGAVPPKVLTNMVWGARFFFALFWVLLRQVCVSVSNGPGKFGGSASQGSFSTCFEAPRFQTDPVHVGPCLPRFFIDRHSFGRCFDSGFQSDLVDLEAVPPKVPF